MKTLMVHVGGENDNASHTNQLILQAIRDSDPVPAEHSYDVNQHITLDAITV